MAAAEARWEGAIAYLERATSFCEEKGLVVELAHCRLALSDALMRRSPSGKESPSGSCGSLRVVSPEELQRAIALLDQALADYQRLGMPLYVQDALARREILKA